MSNPKGEAYTPDQIAIISHLTNMHCEHTNWILAYLKARCSETCQPFTPATLQLEALLTTVFNIIIQGTIDPASQITQVQEILNRKLAAYQVQLEMEKSANAQGKH